MKRLVCEDCGYRFESWDRLYQWPESGRIQLLCECCAQERTAETNWEELAFCLGAIRCTADELATTPLLGGFDPS
mgnify:CR=1 FL=1